MKFIIKTGGGLGDICYDFLHDDYLSKCKVYTQSFLSSYVKLLIVAHNPFSKDLFKEQKWIDEIKQVEYTHTLTPYLSEFEGFIEPKYKEIISLDDKPLEIYLSNEEKENVKELTENKHVILHPFAGQNDRTCMSDELLKEIIEVNIKNYKVYLIGANYDRIHHEKEEFDHPNVVDLIDRLSIRELIKLTEHENCIGIHCTHSLMSILAWHFKKPVIVYYPVHDQSKRKKWDAQELIESAQKTKWNFGKNYKLTKMIPILV